MIARAADLCVAAPPAEETDVETRRAPSADVAMLVASRSDGELTHACFCELGRFLRAGDLLVVNTSATLPAALPAEREGEQVELHLSTPAEGETWLVELRTLDRRPLRAPGKGATVELPDGASADTVELPDGASADTVELPDGASAELLAPYLGSTRLWVARLSLGEPVVDYLARHGHPIRYRHSPDQRPIGDYQTVFARDPGSAEMPSAARPFTAELVTELVARGVMFAPLTLHCGVSSLESGESPYPERYDVPAQTAWLVNSVRWHGGRVIAVGTTAVRALETVSSPEGFVTAGSGLTNLVVTAERGLRAVDGLITGWHEPESSHLQLLEAAAGPDLLRRSYDAAYAGGYAFHEFGDSHLLLP